MGYVRVEECHDDSSTDSPPGFIVGTGRCGSTLLYKLLAMHPQSNFLTGALNKRPEALILNKAFVWLKHHSRSWSANRRPHPSEAWEFWNFHIPGFNAPFRDLVSEDVTKIQKKTVIHILDSLRSARYGCLIIKFTGWTRVGFIKEIYPDAPIVHVIRDPRAVAQSFLQVPWWDGWRGPSQWRWGDLTPDEDKVWRDSGNSFIVLAAINWKKVMEAYWISKNRLPEDQKRSVIEKSYQRFCSNTVNEIEDIRQHLGLPTDQGFLDRVAKHEIRSQDDKWRNVFTEGQIHRLEKALEDLRWGELMNGQVAGKMESEKVVT